MLFVRKIRPFIGKTKQFTEFMAFRRIECNNNTVRTIQVQQWSVTAYQGLPHSCHFIAHGHIKSKLDFLDQLFIDYFLQLLGYLLYC